MPPHQGLVHPKEYDWRDSNVELVGSEVDHKVKYNSAATEPAWNNGAVGQTAGLFVWRIEDFEVIPWPKDKYGRFHEGDSYIVLHSYKIGSKTGQDRLGHDIFFWLGRKTSQDEAGVAAYKTMELDEFLHGVATQHRELQASPSDDFVALFPRISILAGGVASGFTHVETKEQPDETLTLLRVFKHPGAGRTDSVMVYEVEPTWQSLDEDDVFILETKGKIWVWQGRKCNPMEKAKAAQVVHDMTIAKHVDVEVLSQADSRSRIVVSLLGGNQGPEQDALRSARPVISARKAEQQAPRRAARLCRLSDAPGQVSLTVAKEGQPIGGSDLDSNDVFVFDDGKDIWVWQGANASKAERALWLRAAQAYIRRSLTSESDQDAAASSITKVVEGYESAAFQKALEAR